MCKPLHTSGPASSRIAECAGTENVLVPDTYDPALNLLYRDVIAHYGAARRNCDIRTPMGYGCVTFT
jgi:hypothetical protein